MQNNSTLDNAAEAATTLDLYNEKLLRKAEISDIFFNYAAVSYLYAPKNDKRSKKTIKEDLLFDAIKFNELIVDSPYTAPELVADFYERL